MKSDMENVQDVTVAMADEKDQPELMTPDQRKAFLAGRASALRNELQQLIEADPEAAEALKDLEKQRGAFAQASDRLAPVLEKIQSLQNYENQISQDLQAAIAAGKPFEKLLRDQQSVSEKVKLLNEQADQFENETVGKQKARADKALKRVVEAISPILNKDRSARRKQLEVLCQQVEAEAFAYNVAQRRLFSRLRLGRHPVKLMLTRNRWLRQLMVSGGR